jgi:hypothetical protein
MSPFDAEAPMTSAPMKASLISRVFETSNSPQRVIEVDNSEGTMSIPKAGGALG